MLQKFFILTLLLSLIVTKSIGSDLPHSRTSSYFKYIYRLTPKEAKGIYKRGLSVVDESYFHHLVDSIPNDSAFHSKLPQGNYLLLWAQKNELKFELRSYSDIDVMVHNNYADLMLTISDNVGNPVSDAKVRINEISVNYKKSLQAYHKANVNKTGWLEVTYRGFTSYHYLGNQVKKGVRFRKIVYSFPIKYVYIPVRLIAFLPYDIVRTVKTGYTSGLIYYVYSPFRDAYKSIFNYGTYGWINSLVRKSEKTWESIVYKEYGGYMVFSQPKYKPDDLVRFKAFINRPNGTPVSKQELKVRLTGNGKILDLGVIKPNRRGAYDFEFFLHDSLHLLLDKEYRISLVRNNWNVMISREFKYEDYELKHIKYTLRTDSKSHLKGHTMHVYLKGEDMNGLNVPDGRVRIDLLSQDNYGELFASKAFLPDTLYSYQQNLDPVGETIIEIPDSIFPSLNFNYRINAVFLTSDNERIEKSSNINYFFNKKEIKLKGTSKNLFLTF